jgi:AraC family transcriptional activator FtrA
MAHRVVALVFDGLAPFELGIVVEVFGLARPELAVEEWYELTVCSPAAGCLDAVGGFAITTARGLEALETADTVVLPSWPHLDEEVPGPIVDALLAAHDRGARLVSICSGAFVLAATGLVDGRRVATHWRHAATLARRHPEVLVDERALYAGEGRLWSSAGSAAGIDLCLHLVRSDHGGVIANHVARRLVSAPHRAGDQAQFVQQPVEPHDDDRLSAVMQWATANLADGATVNAMAERAFMSPRHFSRRFRTVAGESPRSWLLRQRSLAAMALLEQDGRSIEAVAHEVGMGPGALRRRFRATVGMSPADYRRTFRAY